MALDPSIPLSVKPIQLPDPLEMFSAIEQVKGQREELVGRIQEKYGIARDEAERQVRDWEGQL